VQPALEIVRIANGRDVVRDWAGNPDEGVHWHFKRSFEFSSTSLVHSLATPSSVAQLRKAYMKKLMFTAVVLVGLAFAPKTRAGVSVDISIGDGYGYRTPRYQAVTPYCPPPARVHVVPNNSCELPRYDYHPSHRRGERWHHREFRRFHR
jgi:hypothetical protein